MIRRRLPLAAGVSRCPSTRKVHCAQADTCARAIEPHDKGRPVQDFSTEARAAGGNCVWFVRICYASTADAAPRVHDAPEGLC